MKRLFFFLGTLILLGLTVLPARLLAAEEVKTMKYRGMNYTSWWAGEFSSENSTLSLKQLKKETAVDSIFIVVTYYMADKSSSELIANERTPTIEDVRAVIKDCKKIGLTPMIKIHIDPLDSNAKWWRGEIDPKNSKEWFKNYSAVLTEYIKLSDEHDLPLFVFGTELKVLSRKHPKLWQKLTHDIKATYKGELVYASNWDNFSSLTFMWEDTNVSYIGIDSYFPLVSGNNSELLMGWEKWLKLMENTSKKYNKPILITEIGYMSQKGNCIRPWVYWKKGEVDLKAQGRAYRAAMTALKKPFIHGIFWWNWEPKPYDKGKTIYKASLPPQGKPPAMEALKNWK